MNSKRMSYGLKMKKRVQLRELLLALKLILGSKMIKIWRQINLMIMSFSVNRRWYCKILNKYCLLWDGPIIFHNSTKIGYWMLWMIVFFIFWEKENTFMLTTACKWLNTTLSNWQPSLSKMNQVILWWIQLLRSTHK